MTIRDGAGGLAHRPAYKKRGADWDVEPAGLHKPVDPLTK